MKRMIVFVVFVWLCGCREPLEQPDPRLSDMSHLPPLEGDAQNNPHHFVPPAGLVTDFEQLDARFELQLGEVRAVETERRKRVEEERQRKLTLYNGWLEFLQSRREEVMEVLAAKVESEKLIKLEMMADETGVSLVGEAAGHEYHPLKVKITENGVETDWRLTADKQTESINTFFRQIFNLPAPDRKPR